MTTPAQRRLLDRLEAAEAASPIREGREIYVPMIELREVLDAARYVPCDYPREDLVSRALLQKYMEHVAGQEGTDFTEYLDVYADWTDEEAATMQALSEANQQARRGDVTR